MLCIGIIFYIVFKYSKNLAFALFFVNSLMFALSGWLLRVVGELIEVLPLRLSAEFKARSVLAFQDFPHENLIFYDLTNFAAIGSIPLLIIWIRQESTSLRKLFFLGLLITSFFEFYGFVIATSLLILDWKSSKQFNARRSLKQTIAIVLGSISWILIITFYFKLVRTLRPDFYLIHGDSLNARGAGDLLWAIKNPIENLVSNPSIHFQVFLVLLQAAVAGLLLGALSTRFLKSIEFKPEVLQSLFCVMWAMVLVQFIALYVTYGVLGMAAEHARQTLGLQISLFTYLFLKTATSKSSLERTNSRSI